MKGILALLRMSSRNPKAQQEHGDSVFFSTAFATQGVDASMLVPWDARAVEIGAKRMAASRGGKLLQMIWSKDKYMAQLEADSIKRMEHFFEFAQVPPNRDVIRQDEYGNFMIVLLTGTIAVDRVQPWGEQLRLAETRPGDILGEMSLLDSGIRFSACTTLTDCEIAVLSADAMDEMMTKDPQLAASLIALLARKLSLRLRAVSARLSENQK
ncbi:MAG: Crp/Fnr family transcriptional regulator [Burkholderiales bacterium 68-12]|uniref:cyclic nucleotide-binding domain-containing protein n=1 Tax=Comamonas granuli TaxID=290309 RepID=UPI0005A8CCEA|nr:cyclic nucleotide-binding domain-containing protein [Comamonas granuli]MCZ2405154.1 cyclic nucleotide-binding domain-containing protein [Burkholderiales bacterium]OJX35392.1 MAG: Crp/Fnr family transcriptional regulator [Burkholderiales bacterium 68-12]